MDPLHEQESGKPRRASLLERLFLAPLGTDFTADETFRIRTFTVLFIPYIVLAFALTGYLSLRPALTPFVGNVGWGICGFLVLAYLVARTRWHRVGVWIVVLSVWLGITGTLSLKFDSGRFLALFPYLTLASVTAGLFLGSAETLIVALGIVLTGMSLLAVQLPPELHAVGVRAAVFLFMTSGLAAVARYHFSWLEKHKARLSDELKENKTRLELAHSLETIGKLSAIGEVATTLSDEIRAPLQTLIKSCENLGERGLATNKEVQELSVAAHRIERTVNNLQRMADRSLHESIAEESLTAIVQSAVDFLKEKAVRRKVAIWFDETNDHLLVGHGGEILQAVVNLLNNAVDGAGSTADRWVELRIEAAQDAYTVFVTDSGPGIPEEVRERLLEPFFSAKPLGRGTGLGLPLTRWAAERQGGGLDLLEGSRHTTFALRLARKRPPAQGDSRDLPRAAS